MTDSIKCPSGGKHEKYNPEGNPPDWNLMNWLQDPKNKNLQVNMCKKCHLLYWELLQ